MPAMRPSMPLTKRGESSVDRVLGQFDGLVDGHGSRGRRAPNSSSYRPSRSTARCNWLRESARSGDQPIRVLRQHVVDSGPVCGDAFDQGDRVVVHRGQAWGADPVGQHGHRVDAADVGLVENVDGALAGLAPPPGDRTTVVWCTRRPVRRLTRPRYRPSRVSTFTFSPVLTNNGTWISAAGLQRRRLGAAGGAVTLQTTGSVWLERSARPTRASSNVQRDTLVGWRPSRTGSPAGSSRRRRRCPSARCVAGRRCPCP